MAFIQSLFPDGKPKALTLSYDDGTTEDRRLVEVLNNNGIRATFHLNSGLFGKENKLSRNEVTALFSGHEIAVHSVSHPFLERLPVEQACAEISQDRRELEQLSGALVRGMSYPFGTWEESVVHLLRASGIDYSRTTVSTYRFDLPRNFLLWDPTCHHNEDLLGRAKEFLALKKPIPALFFVWGHSCEFDRDNSWKMIEAFCTTVSRKEDVWYATNIEIADYVCALRALRFSIDKTRALNPSSHRLWLMIDDRTVEIPSGETVSLV